MDCKATERTPQYLTTIPRSHYPRKCQSCNGSQDYKRRKLYDEQQIFKIASGIDGKVWVNGVDKDSFSGEGHQDQYYPIQEQTKEQLQEKILNFQKRQKSTVQGPEKGQKTY